MDGILIVNKSSGCTSHDVVSKVRKICGEKVGHTGTLDPLATGVLPLLIGKGTKISEYITNHDKIYEATIQLGIKTDTADSEGKIIDQKEVVMANEEKVQKTLHLLIGKQKQVPPIYSSIKINGKKLYEYARENKKVEIPEREIEIYNTQLLDINNNNKTITYKVSCSKGTYIRTLCETIAEKLNTIGYMKNLTRIKVGEFDLKNSVTIQQIENNKEFWEQNLITIPSFFSYMPYILLNNKELTLFYNGVKLNKKEEDGIYQIKTLQDKWIGLGIIKNDLLKRKLVIENIGGKIEKQKTIY